MGADLGVGRCDWREAVVISGGGEGDPTPRPFALYSNIARFSSLALSRPHLFDLDALKLDRVCAGYVQRSAPIDFARMPYAPRPSLASSRPPSHFSHPATLQSNSTCSTKRKRRRRPTRLSAFHLARRPSLLVLVIFLHPTHISNTTRSAFPRDPALPGFFPPSHPRTCLSFNWPLRAVCTWCRALHWQAPSTRRHYCCRCPRVA